MKAEIHPDYHEITVVMTDGTEYKTRSTYGKEGDVIKLDIDPLTHPAWQGGTGKVVEKGQLDKFEGRYGTFLSGEQGAAPKKGGKEEKAEAAPAEEEKPEEAEAAPEAPAEEAPVEETKDETPAEEAPAKDEPKE